MKRLEELQPGNSFRFAGEPFTVLEQRDGMTFVLLDKLISQSVFSLENGNFDFNDYSHSFLKNVIDEWVAQLPRNVVETVAIRKFELDLSCTDRSSGYGFIEVKAAPLTLWQYGKFKGLYPNIIYESRWWLVTPYQCRWVNRPHSNVSCSAWYVNRDGDSYSGFAKELCGVRPALLLCSDTLVSVGSENETECITDNSTNLSGFTTEDLLDEVKRRLNRTGGVKHEP